MEIGKAAVREMCDWAQRFPTVEVSGIVARGPHGDVVIPMRNVHKDPERYFAWDREDMGDAYTRMDQQGEHPVAFYHSHPNGRPTPSEADMEGALNVGMHYLILYPHHGLWMFTAWECIEMGILISVPLEVGS